MSFQEEIIEHFKLNLSHARYCKQCFATTSSPQFWIWDPSDNPNPPYSEQDVPMVKFAHLLESPTERQTQESIEIQCNSTTERTLLALDKCLIKEGQKCDGMLFFKRNLFWIELKMNMKRQNPKPTTLEGTILGEKNALDQILAARNVFLAKGVDLSPFKQRGFVAIPEELMELAKKSNNIQARIIKLRKTLTITIGSKLTLE